ncbi:hypothetical protein HHK36_000961 [Tetracentron sinense]|uniref:Uncharacterized protein n=1 Tax=Tetracentron sinense TaxID=13715 RepID=A0A834ZSF6_TETSI|nr:hypothetical protein HHK36_000961 [Tetracentron sinense]
MFGCWNELFEDRVVACNNGKSAALERGFLASKHLDKLVIFLAKRDGIDKLVKTLQYVSKIVHWHLETTNPDTARRAKQWEVASGLSRKAFRSGRFLTGFNSIRRNPGSTPTFRFLSVLANAGEMVYFFFDHFLWVSRIGVLDSKLAMKMSFISAFGEAFGYIFFIISDFIIIKEGLEAQRKLSLEPEMEKIAETKENIRKIFADRVMRLMAMAANIADLVIAVADIEPNPVCNHAVTLGISGLVSAWAGCFRHKSNCGAYVFLHVHSEKKTKNHVESHKKYRDMLCKTARVEVSSLHKVRQSMLREADMKFSLLGFDLGTTAFGYERTMGVHLVVLAKLNFLAMAGHGHSSLVTALVWPFTLKLPLSSRNMHKVYTDAAVASRLFLFRLNRIVFGDELNNANSRRWERALRLVYERFRSSTIQPDEDSLHVVSMLSL